ncbi:MAG: hypothetical protein ACYTG0_28660 [Planctomycetota bacterium]|jgi:hypothetical protein
MGTKRTRDLPAGLEGLRRRFERWRRTRKVRARIPEPLWASAVKLAGRYGIHRTAKALRVDYYALKKRVEGASAVIASKMPAEVAKRQFVELPAAAWPGSGECTLELEDAVGAKLRVHLKGFEAPDLAALSRSFWQSES